MKTICKTVLAWKLLPTTILVTMILLPNVLFAQEEFNDALESVRDWIFIAAGIIFTIAIVAGLVKVIISFVSGSPNAFRQLGYLILAIVAWAVIIALVPGTKNLPSIFSF